jgi:hypothetical protein
VNYGLSEQTKTSVISTRIDKVFTLLLEEQTVAGKRESTEKLMLLIYSIYFSKVLSLQ